MHANAPQSKPTTKGKNICISFETITANKSKKNQNNIFEKKKEIIVSAANARNHLFLKISYFSLVFFKTLFFFFAFLKFKIEYFFYQSFNHNALNRIIFPVQLIISYSFCQTILQGSRKIHDIYE